MATKSGTESAITRLIYEISARSLCIAGFSGSGYWMMPDKFYCDQPLLPWQRNLRQNRL